MDQRKTKKYSPSANVAMTPFCTRLREYGTIAFWTLISTLVMAFYSSSSKHKYLFMYFLFRLFVFMYSLMPLYPEYSANSHSSRECEPDDESDHQGAGI